MVRDDYEAAGCDVRAVGNGDGVLVIHTGLSLNACNGDASDTCVVGLRRFSERNGDGVGPGGHAVLSGNGEGPDVSVMRQSADGRAGVARDDHEAVRRNVCAIGNGDSVGVVFACCCFDVRDSNASDARVIGLRRCCDRDGEPRGDNIGVLVADCGQNIAACCCERERDLTVFTDCFALDRRERSIFADCADLQIFGIKRCTVRLTVFRLQAAAVGVHIAIHAEREVRSGLNCKRVEPVSIRIREPGIIVHVHAGVLIEEELNSAVFCNGCLADGVAGVAVLRVVFAVLVAGELAVDRETERGGFFSVDRGDRAVADDEIIALAVLREVLTEGELVVLDEHVQRGNAICDIISVAIAFGKIAGDFHAGRNHDKHIFCLHGNGRVDRLGLFHRDCDGVGHGSAVLSGHSKRPDAVLTLGRAGKRGLAVGKCDLEAVCRDLRACRKRYGEAVFSRTGCCRNACNLDRCDARVVGLDFAVNHIDGVGALAVARFIHGGPAVVCTDDGDDAAICDGDQGRAGIFAARSLRAEIGADLIVLVCRRRCDEQRGRAFRHSQGVGEGVAAELGRQLTCAERERFEAGVGIVPAAAKILNGTGVHDADLVARAERALCNGKFTKAKVCEPVVECAHPAGHRAALLLLEVVNGGDVVAFRADDGVAIQCFHNAAHHGRFVGQFNPGVGQRAFPRSALRLRERGVLHDHTGHTGQRQNADIRRVGAALGGIVLHIGQRQCVAACCKLLLDAAALLAADSVSQRFRAAAVGCERDGQFVIAVFRGNAVAEAQNSGGAQRKGERGRGTCLVLLLVAALKAVQIGIVDPGVIAVVGNADRGDSLLGVGDVAEAVVVPDRVGFAADGADVGLIAGEDLLGAVLGRMALGGNDVFLRF